MLLRYYDEKTQVVRIEGNEETTQVTKSTPGFDILFVNENIDFRESYLSDIVQRFMNSEPMKIVHVSVRFKTPPFILENMNIYNEIKLDSLIEQLVAYYNETNLQDKNLIVLLKFAILARLAEINIESPIYHFFAQLSQKIMGLISLEGKWTKLEGKILEYKSGDILAGGNETIVNKLSEDILRKLKEFACKIYFIGVEDDGIVNPLPISRLKSDRIETIRAALQDALDVTSIYMCPVIREGKGLLLITVHRPT
jgi:hypothetical protein